MTLTTDEAAIHLNVKPATIRKWVVRGYLEPVRRGAKPLRFRELDLARCYAERQTPEWHARLDTLWADIVARTA